MFSIGSSFKFKLFLYLWNIFLAVRVYVQILVSQRIQIVAMATAQRIAGMTRALAVEEAGAASTSSETSSK